MNQTNISTIHKEYPHILKHNFYNFHFDEDPEIKKLERSILNEWYQRDEEKRRFRKFIYSFLAVFVLFCIFIIVMIAVYQFKLVDEKLILILIMLFGMAFSIPSIFFLQYFYKNREKIRLQFSEGYSFAFLFFFDLTILISALSLIVLSVYQFFELYLIN